MNGIATCSSASKRTVWEESQNSTCYKHRNVRTPSKAFILPAQVAPWGTSMKWRFICPDLNSTSLHSKSNNAEPLSLNSTKIFINNRKFIWNKRRFKINNWLFIGKSNKIWGYKKNFRLTSNCLRSAQCRSSIQVTQAGLTRRFFPIWQSGEISLGILLALHGARESIYPLAGWPLKPGLIVTNATKPSLIAPYTVQESASSSRTRRLSTNVRLP